MRVSSQWRSVWASSLLLLAALLVGTVQASALRGSDASVLQPQLAHRVEIVEEAPMRVEAGVVGEAPPAVLPHSLAAMASEAQHSAQSGVDVDASAFAAAVQQVVEQEWAFLATRGFQQELQMSSAPTQPSQACEVPMARTVGVATVSCEQKTTLAINEQCVLSCKPGYALVGKPYKCVSGGFGRPAHLAGKQRCEPACPPMSAAQLAEINRGASTPAGAGTCGKLTAGGARCGISCEAGATYTGSPYVCQVKTGRYLGTGRCTIRSAAEKAAARAPEAAAKARAAGIAASKARAAARQQQQQVLQPAAAPKAAAPKAAAPKRNGRKLFEFLRSLNLPAEVQQHLPEQLQSEKALMSLESQTHAGTEVLVGGPLDALLSAGSDDNKVDSFGAYLKTFVSRYDASAVKGNLAQNFRDGSSAILVRWALNGNATGEVLKKKQLLYKGVQSPDSVQALALWKEAITEVSPSKLFQPSVADSEVCNKLPIDPLLPGHKVFALMVADSALCMQMHAPSRSFGIYFQFGAALQALIPPPMQGFKAAGLAVSLKRGLRVEEMKDLALGFGTGVHAITPQTCLSSGSALVSDEQTPPSQVPQYSLLGCKGHVWAQMEAEWNPLDLLPAPVKENIEKYSTGLAEAKLEGRATMLVDLEPDSLASLTKQQLLEREEQERLRTITLTAAPQPASEVTFTYPDGRKEIISSAAVTATNIAPKRDNTVANYVAQVTKGSSAGFSAYIQAQLTASLQMGVFFKGGIDVSALATVYAQGFTQQRLPAVDAWDEGDDTADGLYVQLEVSLELKAKYLEAIDFIKRKVGGSALANQTVSNPPIPDAEWDKTVKNAIRIKLAINGRGLTLIFQFNERSVSITIGFMSAELCVLWSKDDKCVGGHLISLRGLARKAGEFQQWLVRGARKFLDSHSELARLIETPMGTVVARPDQPVAWLVPADTNTAPTKLPLSFMEKYLQVSKLRAKDLAVLAAASSKMKFVDKLTKQVVDLNLGSQSWFERTFLTSKEEDEARAAMSAIIREAVASSSELHAAVLHTLCASKTEQKCIHTKREKKFMLSPAPPKPALDHVRVNICRLVTHGSGAAEEKTCELNPDYLFYLNQLSSDKKKFL